MCLISVLPKGTIKYNKEVKDFITSGFHSNTDGSGIMWKKNGEKVVNIKKGFFNLEELLSFIENLNLIEEDELVVHHRACTQGAISKENSHPFVVTNDHVICIALEGSFNLPILTHNGIFHGLHKHDRVGFSDTYSFCNGMLSKPYMLDFFKDDPELFTKAFSDIFGWSKLCLLFPDRDLIMTGNFTEDGGYYHSNQCYNNSYWRDIGGYSSYKGKKLKTGKKNTTGVTCKVGFTRHSSQQEIDEQINDFNNNIGIDKQDRKLLSIVKLDDLDIDIDENNYKNFVYLLKDGVNIKGFDINVGYRATGYSKETGTCRLFVPNNDKMQTILTLSSLKSCFYYTPTSEFKSIYNDYIYLIKNLSATKSQFKKLTKMVSSKYNANSNSRFLIKSLGVPMSKGSVQMWLNKYKDKFNKGFKPAIFELNDDGKMVIKREKKFEDSIISD